ncbi:hypothetical protein AAHA92_18446 [Salvia divinorum]|uniref:WW domain-containing protein n=1 Tax=Salvia divinorum TaxID=28513 RepID=A0ABD1H245_SALDI
MATPNIATIERSLQNCSLNHQLGTSSGGAARSQDLPAAETLELNSEGVLPLYWEQCLDLKTGEIYYINWRTGMKATEDPRTASAVDYGGEFYSEDSSSYDSDGWSSESSPASSSREQWSGKKNEEDCCDEEQRNVVVVAGCKGCLRYYMVPKHRQICPKCCAQLLHLHPSQNAST